MSDIWQISHSAHRRGRFDFHLDRLCAIDGLPSSCGLAPDSGGRSYQKNQILTLAAASRLSESSGGDTPALCQKNRRLMGKKKRKKG
jgi:hypothetical protein